MTILAAVSSGRSDFWISAFSKIERPDGRRGRDGLDRCGAAVADRREGRGAHRDDLLLVGALHGLDGVAGVDRPLEGVGRHHLDDVGDLHHVEQGGDARHEVLARGRRGGDAPRRSWPSGRRSAPPSPRRAGGRDAGASASSTLAAPSSLAAASATGLAVGAGHQHVDVLAERLGGAHGLGDGGESALLSCSATRRTLMKGLPPL